MPRLLILHTNDIHGRVDALARCATIVERERAAAVMPSLYLDSGDVEDTAFRLSGLTKGRAMNQLLVAAGVDAVCVGNASMLRYGPAVLEDYERTTGMPQLAANIAEGDAPVRGTVPTVELRRGDVRVGVVGLTPPMFADVYANWGIRFLDAEAVTRESANGLRARGADVVVLLSHLGIDDDRALAQALEPGVVDVIVGGHSHTVLPEGEWVSGVPIAHAGDFGRYVGRIELDDDEVSMRLLPVDENVPEHPVIVEEAERLERELEHTLAVVVGALEEPLEVADDRECSAARFLADVLREKVRAEVGLATAGVGFERTLAAGPLTRGALYEACPDSAVAAAADLPGHRLVELVVRGLDASFAAERPRSHRGRARGLMHVAGAEIRGGILLVNGRPVEPERMYRVAATDWELNAYGGYVTAEWGLDVEDADPTILRELVEERLARDPVIRPTVPRWDGVPLRPL